MDDNKQLYFNPWKPVAENDSTLFTALLSISTCVFHSVMQHYGTRVIYSVNKHLFNGVHWDQLFYFDFNLEDPASKT